MVRGRTFCSIAAQDERSTGAGRRKAARYWRELPVWLFDLYEGNKAGSDLSHRFLNAVRWGQHCQFLAIRIQDDIFDGEMPSSALLYVSDQLLLEADHTFSRLIAHSSPFWNV